VPLRILLADDSMTAQKMGQKILVDAGHTVIAVSNGAAAVKKIASEKPDMAVLDIYMPGYTGLEVCERVRAAQETAKIPVLLTVGKMEMGTFKPEDATRVKADGVIIKPFEASDLLAAVKKIEQKLAMVVEEAPPEYERTMKINMAEILKQDSSYQEWQVTADEHKDEEAAEEARAKRNTDVPSEMAGDAAMMDMLGDEPIEAQAAALEAAAPVPETPKMAEPEIEPTSAKHEVEVAHGADPHFEPTVSQEHIEVAHTGQDPALVTDATEMASAFVTKFGVDNPEPIVVGVAADANIDGLYSDSAPPEEAAEEARDELSTRDISGSIAHMREREAAMTGKAEEGAELAGALPEVLPDVSDDDFEKRVAAAMGSYESPAAAAHASEPEPEHDPEPAMAAAAAAAESAPVVAVASSWVAQETPVDHHEANVSLDQEMLKAFSASVPHDPEPPAPAPEAEPEPQAATSAAPTASAVASNAPDMELATAMAAAVSPDSPPMAAAAAATAASVGDLTGVDPARLAEAIHRAIDRMKPELIAHIAKDLEQK
jgi:CheY-like chemotaxis protein